jgi:hypothetical protein
VWKDAPARCRCQLNARPDGGGYDHPGRRGRYDAELTEICRHDRQHARRQERHDSGEDRRGEGELHKSGGAADDSVEKTGDRAVADGQRELVLADDDDGNASSVRAFESGLSGDVHVANPGNRVASFHAILEDLLERDAGLVTWFAVRAAVELQRWAGGSGRHERLDSRSGGPVASSTPWDGSVFRIESGPAPVAQRIERGRPKACVGSSNLSGGANLILVSIEYHRGMKRTSRLLAIASGLLLLILAIPWAATALFIGSANIFFLVLLGLYALGLAWVGLGLLRPRPAALGTWVASVVLPLAPVVASVTLRVVLPQPDSTGVPDSGPWTLLLPLVAAVLSLVAFVASRTGAESSVVTDRR